MVYYLTQIQLQFQIQIQILPPFSKGSKRFPKVNKQINKLFSELTQFKTSEDRVKRETICNVIFLEEE